ncbi:NADPH-dependent FMN reductase [Yoonia sp. 208BN28-4]|uniref:NADPH-dependent FMN reductase n=1 Tax=Yoonia sp. 208BN28-4 TaxID=3126505 RepID=UPI0030AA2E0C
MATLLGISGSLRAASTNTALLHEAAKAFGPGTFTLADLRLPLYDGDLEQSSGIPTPVQILADQIAQADAVIISTPEYNKGISGVLKNALDWVSRTDGSPWSGKPLAIMSATAGRAGGERAQTMLVSCLAPFRPRLMFGPEVLVGSNQDNFDDDGNLTNDMNLKALNELMDNLKAAI